jgi:phytoene dehydrogenase-like protein
LTPQPGTPNKRHDAIVVGAGHNGLIAAGYLARAGKKVLVLERRDVIGGATVTEEPWPGYRLSTCSYVCSLLLPEVIRDLELVRHGYRVRPIDPQYFVPFPTAATSCPFWMASGRRPRSASSPRKDAAAYDYYWEMWDRIVDRMRPLLMGPPPTPEQLEAAFAGPEGEEDWRTLTRKSIAELLEGFFESEEVKAPLCVGGVIGTNAGPRTPGTAYVKFHHILGNVGGHRGAWGYVEGGMGSVADALAASARERSAEILTNAEVAEVGIRDGAARGVVLHDGRSFEADIVLSNADPMPHLPRDGGRGTPAGGACRRAGADAREGLGRQGVAGSRGVAGLRRGTGEGGRAAAHGRDRHKPVGGIFAAGMGGLRSGTPFGAAVHGGLHPERDGKRSGPAQQTHAESFLPVRAV